MTLSYMISALPSNMFHTAEWRWQRNVECTVILFYMYMKRNYYGTDMECIIHVISTNQICNNTNQQTVSDNHWKNKQNRKI